VQRAGQSTLLSVANPAIFTTTSQVIIITHAYRQRVGVRYLTSGVKVYYLPLWLIYEQVSLPTLYGAFPMYRNIFLREGIDIVHGHQVGVTFITLSMINDSSRYLSMA
jgi:hypothetical protein